MMSPEPDRDFAVSDSINSSSSSPNPTSALNALLDDATSYDAEVLRLLPPHTEELIHRQLRLDAFSLYQTLDSPSDVFARAPSLTSSSSASRSSFSLDSPTADSFTTANIMVGGAPRSNSLSDYIGPPPPPLLDSPPRAMSEAHVVPQLDMLSRIVRPKQSPKKSKSPSESVESLETKPKRRGLLGRLRREPKRTLNTDRSASIAGAEKPTAGSASSNQAVLMETVHPTPFQNVARLHLQSHEILNDAVKDASFREIQTQAEDEHKRFMAYETRLHETLTKHFEDARASLKTLHADRAITLKLEHNQALEAIEERQVIMEHELRNAQTDERQNTLTALKHMEAYCSESSTRTITDEDRSKLQAQRTKRDLLDAKHASAINVLRQKQDRFMRMRKQKQLQELTDLDRHFIDRVTATLEQEEQMLTKLVEVMCARNSRLTERWNMKVQMWKRQRDHLLQQEQNGTANGATAAVGRTAASSLSLPPSPTPLPVPETLTTSGAFSKFREVDWWSRGRAASSLTQKLGERPRTAVA